MDKGRVHVLITRLCGVHMSIGVLCAIRTMLANLKSCRNTLDSLYFAEEVLAEKEVEIANQLFKELGWDVNSAVNSADFTVVKEAEEGKAAD